MPIYPDLQPLLSRLKHQAGGNRQNGNVFAIGGEGARTPCLVIANDALYQMSYTPENLPGNSPLWSTQDEFRQAKRVRPIPVQARTGSSERRFSAVAFSLPQPPNSAP